MTRQNDMRAVLTDIERARVDHLLNTMTSKPAEAFTAGEFFQISGTFRIKGTWLKRGIYCVRDWKDDHLVAIPYGQQRRIEVPHTNGAAPHMLTKYPLELVVLSERARERAEASCQST